MGPNGTKRDQSETKRTKMGPKVRPKRDQKDQNETKVRPKGHQKRTNSIPMFNDSNKQKSKTKSKNKGRHLAAKFL